MAAEAQRVGDTEGDVALEGNIRSIIKIAFGIRAVEVDGRRDNSFLQRKYGGDGFCGTGGAEHVASHRLDGADMGLVGKISERSLVGYGFGHIVQVRAGAVGVDVEIVFGFIETCFLEGQADTFRLGFAVGARCCGMVSVAGVAVAHHLAVDLGSAGLGVLEFLKDEDTGAVAHYEALAVLVERQGGVFGIIDSGRYFPPNANMEYIFPYMNAMLFQPNQA